MERASGEGLRKRREGGRDRARESERDGRVGRDRAMGEREREGEIETYERESEIERWRRRGRERMGDKE